MATRIKQLGLALALGGLSIAAAGSVALAKTANVKGVGTASFTTAFFTYDATAPANQIIGSGKDTLGGAYNFQGVAELVFDGTACTAPDQSAGSTYDLIQSDVVTTYKKGLVYSTAPAATGAQCVSSTTPSSSFSIVYTLTGGTGRYASITGTVTVAGTGQTLAAPGTPPGTNGIFGADSFTQAGTATK